MIEVKNTLNGKLNASIVKEYPELEEVTITPSLEGQELEPNKYGYSKITIEAIPATDVTIAPSEEQQNLKGIFKEVNINPIQVEEITADLDFSSSDAIELKAQEGSYIKKATINKDANLSPENIKSGVTVCGVSGDVADTSDADATSNDIVVGKTAYVANEKIRGTFEPLDTSDATATAGDIAKDKTAYVNGEKVTGTVEDRGYNAKLSDTITSNYFSVGSSITEIDFTNVDMSALTHHRQRFVNMASLVTIKGLKTQNITNMSQMFFGCKSLTNIEYMDVSSLKTCGGMFTECTKLSNESLNIILKMCTDINGEIYTGEKTLATLGLTEAQATICTTLSNYQAFLDADWTTGY